MPTAVAEVEITQTARSDLLSIDDYGFGAFGEDAANRVSAGFRRVFEQLRDYPQSAPARPEYGTDIRCKMHEGYRVLYRFEARRVVVVRVLHHSRDVKSALEV